MTSSYNTVSSSIADDICVNSELVLGLFETHFVDAAVPVVHSQTSLKESFFFLDGELSIRFGFDYLFRALKNIFERPYQFGRDKICYVLLLAWYRLQSPHPTYCRSVISFNLCSPFWPKVVHILSEI